MGLRQSVALPLHQRATISIENLLFPGTSDLALSRAVTPTFTRQMSTRERAAFCQALEIVDPGQRSQFLAQACGADQAMREQVSLASFSAFSKSPRLSAFSPMFK